MAIPGINSKVVDRIIEELGLQSAVDKLPTELMPTIQPVLISNPKRTAHLVKNTTGTGTMYTVPSKTRFFLTGASISSVSQNRNGNSTDKIDVDLPDGTTVTVLSCLTSTAAIGNDSNSSQITFSPSIEVKTGGTITSTKGTTLVNISIFGYEETIL